jgi:hypothetical protein
MTNTQEKNIIKYLELTYGDKKMFDTEISLGISGVCLYYKNSKEVGFISEVHLDLSRWFGEGKYHSVLKKWFFNKIKL